MTRDDGSADVSADPEAAYLKSLNDLNEMACGILESDGYDAAPLRIKLVAFSTTKRKSAILKPRIRERQDAIANVKVGSGKYFQLTGGAALNDNDVFISMKRESTKIEVTKLVADKKKRVQAQERRDAAFQLLQNENRPADTEWTSGQLKTLIAWKTGKACPSKVSSKMDRLQLWLSVKDLPSESDKFLPWGADEEQELKALLERQIENIDIADTELGRQNQISNDAALAAFGRMSEAEKQRFLEEANLSASTVATAGTMASTTESEHSIP